MSFSEIEKKVLDVIDKNSEKIISIGAGKKQINYKTKGNKYEIRSKY